MPAAKSARVQERRRVINKSIRTATRTTVKNAEATITAGDAGEAKQAVTTAVSSLDRAARKGVIHPNNAARRKSRLMKKLNAVAE